MDNLTIRADLEGWRGEEVLYEIVTARSNSAVCLEAGCEYLMWAKMPKAAAVSPSSTMVTELMSCSSAPRVIVVVRMVSSLRGDRWLPLKLISTSDYQ